MKFILPHSMIGYDIADANEAMDNFVAFKRRLDDNKIDGLDLSAAWWRFQLPFAFTYNAWGSFESRIVLPFACYLEAAYYFSAWGAAPVAALTVKLFPNYKSGDAAIDTVSLNSTVNVWQSTLTSPLGAGEVLRVTFVPGAGITDLITVGVTLACKALVEVG